MNNTEEVEDGKIINLISKKVGNTPLCEVWPKKEKNGNRVFAKCEYKNPTGSHYDRVFLRLIEKDIGHIRGEETESVIEVSSGSAGASLVWIARILGFKCKIILPRKTPSGVARHIKVVNPSADIEEPSSENYISSAVNCLRYKIDKFESDFYHINHSHRQETLEATKEIAEECVAQLRNSYNVESIDTFIAACGNGATVVGPAPVLMSEYGSGLNTLVFEPESAPVAYNQIENSEKEDGYGNHSIVGTGAWGVDHPFINDTRQFVDESLPFRNIVDRVFLLSEEDISNISKFRYLIDSCIGTTSLSSLYIASKVIEQQEDKNILLIFYDHGQKYGALN